MAAATHTLVKYRRGRETEVTGTLQELTKYFSYTLEAGHSYKSSIPLQPKTIKSLLSALQKAVAVLEQGSFNPTSFELKQA